MKNARIKQIGIFISLMSAIAVSITGCEKDTKSLLIGKWELVESNMGIKIISDNMEYFKDGTGLSETNIEILGLVAVSFTWKIDSEGRLITIAEGTTQILNIVEISETTLVLEGNVPLYGNIREKYSKLKKGSKSSGTITYTGNRNGDNDNTIETNTIEKSKNKVYPKDYEQYKEQINELEQEAEKWIKNKCSPHEYKQGEYFEEKQGEYFSFSCTARVGCTDCGGDFSSKWIATSKTIIGDCPENSVWKMMYSFDDGYEGGNNEVPPECKSITPNVIINYKFSYSPEGD